jgi:formylglycine-generating enzyme required for sulfatase activity
MQVLAPALVSVLMFLPRCEERLPRPCAPAPEGMRCVFGGGMLRGRDQGPRAERPRGRVWVDTFLMDETEVTVEAYEACVAGGRCPQQKTSYQGFSEPRQPKVGVSWFAARDFCAAHGKRLPTEAEFEKAIRGPDGGTYAWGDDPPACDKVIFFDLNLGRGCGRRSPKPGTGATWPVGSRPPGRYGLFDINGNADEWVLDWYTAGGYDACGDDCRGVDPKGPCQGADVCPGFEERGVRGGSWHWDPSHLPGWFRRPHFPDNRRVYHHFGFRCAKDSVTPWDFVPALYNRWVEATWRLVGRPEAHLRPWWWPGPADRR